MNALFATSGRFKIILPSVAVIVLLVILLFLLRTEAQKLAKRAACASNLASISKGLICYSMGSNCCPTELSLLIARGYSSPKVLICPATYSSDDAHSPMPTTSITPEKILTHSSYVYIPLGETCQLFELPVDHKQEGANLATSSSSVSWLNNDAFLARVQNLNDYLCSQRGGGK